MRNVLIALGAPAALTVTFSAQQPASPARNVTLTGTVVAVNQQSDSITLIDLKTMEAYRHVKVVAAPHEAAVSPDGSKFLMNPRCIHFGRVTASNLQQLDAHDKSVLETPQAPDPTAWYIHGRLHANHNGFGIQYL